MRMRLMAGFFLVAALGSASLALAADKTGVALFGRPGDDPAKEPYQVVHGWPQLPDGFTFGAVSAVGVDSHNHVFVLHRGPQYPIMMFDGATGKFLKSLGEGVLMLRHGLYVDNQDNIWLTDAANASPTGLHQVFKLSHEGKVLMTLGTRGVAGWDGTHFSHPTDVAVAPNGDIFVADGYGNSRIAKFDAQGKFLFDWGTKGAGPGQFASPHGIAIDDQGRVYVADRPNQRIEVFDANGKFISILKPAAMEFPWALRYRDGFLYVANAGDQGAGRGPWPYDTNILKMDLTGKVVAKWGRFGKYDGAMMAPHSIAIAPNGDVYVGEVGMGQRAQKFVLRSN
jgi:peptidylamidoglycolate lyase